MHLAEARGAVQEIERNHAQEIDHPGASGPPSGPKVPPCRCALDGCGATESSVAEIGMPDLGTHGGHTVRHCPPLSRWSEPHRAHASAQAGFVGS